MTNIELIAAVGAALAIRKLSAPHDDYRSGYNQALEDVRDTITEVLGGDK